MEAVLDLLPATLAGAVPLSDAVVVALAAALCALKAATPQAALTDALRTAGCPEGHATALARAATALGVASDVASGPVLVLLASLAGGAPDRAAELVARAERAVASAGFPPEEARRLHGVVATVSAAPQQLHGLGKESAIVGSTAEIAACPGQSLAVSNCDSTSIFVTASLTRVSIRGCRNCTIVAAPTILTVSIDSCEGCTVAVAAPLVSLTNCVGCTLNVWAHAPVAIGGDSRDITIGPYNAVGDGLMDLDQFKRWYVRGDSRFDISGHFATSVRSMRPADFLWRVLPVPQAHNEHIVLPLTFSSENDAVKHHADTASLRPEEARRAETKIQTAFVVSHSRASV